MRKTVAVKGIKDRANTMFKTPDSSLMVNSLTPEQAFRLGIVSLMESILHESGNYHGFRYLPSETQEDGTLRGGYDATRREYI